MYFQRVVYLVGIKASVLFFIISSLIVVFLSPVLADEKLNIYSSRQPEFIKPLLSVFHQLTGIETEVLYQKKGLVEKIAEEGADSPADVILVNEFSQLIKAKELGITQAVNRQQLRNRMADQYRDPEGHWYGLSRRARIILASKERVKQKTISYEELADEKWRGRICIRSVSHPYNVVLIASLIAHRGESWTANWLHKLKQNLAMKPGGGDRTQAKKIYLGKCDIALMNTYYMGAMIHNEKKPEQKKWAAATRILFPNTTSRGSHVSITGMALAKHSTKRENSILLMDFLTSRPAQFIYAIENHEYPIRGDVEASELVMSWGALKPDFVPLDRLAHHGKTAVRLIKKVNFDQAPVTPRKTTSLAK